MSLANRIALLLASVGLMLSGCSLFPGYPENRQAASSLGYLQHRGARYDIRDLMDPTFRAASRDDFARSFNPAATFAADTLRPASSRAVSISLVDFDR